MVNATYFLLLTVVMLDQSETIHGSGTGINHIVLGDVIKMSMSMFHFNQIKVTIIYPLCSSNCLSLSINSSHAISI
jgi:hypothetical protein